MGDHLHIVGAKRHTKPSPLRSGTCRASDAPSALLQAAAPPSHLSITLHSSLAAHGIRPSSERRVTARLYSTGTAASVDSVSVASCPGHGSGSSRLWGGPRSIGGDSGTWCWAVFAAASVMVRSRLDFLDLFTTSSRGNHDGCLVRAMGWSRRCQLCLGSRYYKYGLYGCRSMLSHRLFRPLPSWPAASAPAFRSPPGSPARDGRSWPAVPFPTGVRAAPPSLWPGGRGCRRFASLAGLRAGCRSLSRGVSCRARMGFLRWLICGGVAGLLVGGGAVAIGFGSFDVCAVAEGSWLRVPALMRQQSSGRVDEGQRFRPSFPGAGTSLSSHLRVPPSLD